MNTPRGTQNITLALPEDLLHRVKLLAVERRTSVSGLLVQKLQEIVTENDEYDQARRRYLARLKKPMDLGTGGKATWTRDELHGR